MSSDTGVVAPPGPSDGAFSERELEAMADREPISRNINVAFREKLTFGQRLADAVAAFGGSWSFIIVFGVVLVAWTLTNVALMPAGKAFDPYPFVFLNLILSMLAAIQAPVIMMSQNRQAAKDRMAAAHDYEVNLQAEYDILALHEKIDDIRTARIAELLRRQEEQIDLLRELLADAGRSGTGDPR